MSARAIYAATCAACHGSTGQGGLAPRLGGGASLEAFPDIEDEIAIVSRGLGIPNHAFDEVLTANEIRDVVLFAREDLRG